MPKKKKTKREKCFLAWVNRTMHVRPSFLELATLQEQVREKESELNDIQNLLNETEKWDAVYNAALAAWNESKYV